MDTKKTIYIWVVCLYLLSKISLAEGATERIIYDSGTIYPGSSYEKVIFQSPSQCYFLNQSGQLFQRSTGKICQIKNLDGSIEHLKVYFFDHALFLLIELTDSEDGWGRLIRVTENPFKVCWVVEIPSFNLGDPLFEKGGIYPTGMGFIGKVDIKTGGYIWKNAGIQHDGHFNSFAKPYRDRSNLFIEETRYQGSNNLKLKLRVNPINGGYIQDFVLTGNSKSVSPTILPKDKL